MDEQPGGGLTEEVIVQVGDGLREQGELIGGTWGGVIAALGGLLTALAPIVILVWRHYGMQRALDEARAENRAWNTWARERVDRDDALKQSIVAQHNPGIDLDRTIGPIARKLGADDIPFGDDRPLGIERRIVHQWESRPTDDDEEV